MAYNLLRAYGFAGAMGLAALAATGQNSAVAGVIVVLPTDVSLVAPDQSMWGAGPAIFDSGTHFFGKSWGFFGGVDQPSLSKTLSVSFDGSPSFDASATVRSSGRLGVDFRAVLNTGSVTASYDSAANLTIAEHDSLSVGVRRFSVQTIEPFDPSVAFATTAPRIDVTSNLITILQGSASQTATVRFGGGQQCFPLIGCVTVPPTPVTETQSTPLVNVNSTKQILSVTNEDFLVFEDSITDRQELFREESGEDQLAITFDLGFDPLEVAAGTGLGLDVRVTDGSNPKKPRKSKNLDPKDIVSLAFSMGDITVYAPDLDTEATEFTTEDGQRVLQTSGQTKVAKVDLDVDFLASTGVAMATSVPIPLGATLELGVGPVKFTQEIDIIDADVGAVLFGAQDFTFVPRLDVTLDFNDDVAFRIAGTDEWTIGRTATGKVGDEFEIDYAGTGDLKITPTYSFGNDFTNTTNLLLGGQFAIDLLRFDFRAPFGVPIIGPVQVGQFTFETQNQIPLKTVFDKTFALEAEPIEAKSITIGGIDGAVDGEFAAQLVTGSPVSLSQTVDTPQGPFSLVFDYLFETLTGELMVMLDDVLLGSLVAPLSLQNGFLTATLPILDGSPLIGRTDVSLVFLFDGPKGSSILLDNIVFVGTGGDVFGIPNGGFQSGNLARWVGLSESDGQVRTLNLGVAPTPVPEPGSAWLLLIGLAAVGGLSRLKRTPPAFTGTAV